MTKIRLAYVQTFLDRHGHPRYYFRRAGYARVALPGKPGSPEFMDAYAKAIGPDGAPPRQIGIERTKPNTMSALIVAYYKSAKFTGLAKITQATYRNVMERIRADIGEAPVKDVRRRDVEEILDRLTPGASIGFRKALRILFRFAVTREMIPHHPMDGMDRAKRATEGHATWSEEDITTYCDRWPTGTPQRLALALMLYTAQRRSDVIGMGRQHVKDGHIQVTQQKTGTKLILKIHADLQRELDQVPPNQLTFIQTQYGAPFTANGFTNWIRDARVAAGLSKGLSPHGLRKACLVRLAEAGCTINELMAVSGHKNPQEVAVYTAMADQRRLAENAMATISKARTGTSDVKPAVEG